MTTLNSLLFGSAAAGRHALGRALAPTGLGLLGDVQVSGVAVEPPEVSGVLVDLLDQPLSSVAATAWNTMSMVRRAKQRTLASPGAREVVALGEHTITSTQEPTVEATFAGATTPVLHLAVEVVVKVTAVRLVVEGGEVVDTSPGQARARAKLSAGGAVLAEHDFQPVDLALPLHESASTTRQPAPV